MRCTTAAVSMKRSAALATARGGPDISASLRAWRTDSAVAWCPAERADVVRVTTPHSFLRFQLPRACGVQADPDTANRSKSASIALEDALGG